MAYQKETIVKVHKTLIDLIKLYLAMLIAGVALRVVISTGNRKIGKVLNVSIAPLVTCGNCKECSRYCYDLKACLQYENVRNARAKNTAILQFDRDGYFAQIENKMKRRKGNFYFRFHVSGEIPDIDYFDRMVKLARKFPHFTIWTYTKMYGVVNNWCKQYGKENIPSNLHIMFSEWRGMPMHNPYNFPVFTVRFTSEGEKLLPDVWVCPGNCDICKKAKRGCVVGENVQAHDH